MSDNDNDIVERLQQYPELTLSQKNLMNEAADTITRLRSLVRTMQTNTHLDQSQIAALVVERNQLRVALGKEYAERAP